MPVTIHELENALEQGIISYQEYLEMTTFWLMLGELR